MTCPGKALRFSVFNYYEKLWAHQRGVSGSGVMCMLPRNLSAEMMRELAGELVQVMFF